MWCFQMVHSFKKDLVVLVASSFSFAYYTPQQRSGAVRVNKVLWDCRTCTVIAFVKSYYVLTAIFSSEQLFMHRIRN